MTSKLTAAQKKLFATRPKTWAEMRKALKSVGIQNPEGLSVGAARHSHVAPLGQETHWHNPASLPALEGQLTGKYTKKMAHSRLGAYPWDKLWWVHSGSGGVRGREPDLYYCYSFVIWAADVPEVYAEFLKYQTAINQATAAIKGLLAELESQVAAYRAIKVSSIQPEFQRLEKLERAAKDQLANFKLGKSSPAPKKKRR
jgi:hypothetical protein